MINNKSLLISMILISIKIKIYATKKDMGTIILYLNRIIIFSIILGK